MKSFITPRLSKHLAAVLATAGLAATALGAPLPNFTSTGGATPLNLPGTPDDGMVCRAGYTPSFNGTSFKCSKVVNIFVDRSCTDPNLTKYVARGVAPGTPDGLDICVKDDPTVNIGSTDDISGLIKGKNYVFAKDDPAKITEKTNAQDQAEAAALGLQPGEVDTLAGEATVDKNHNGGLTDKTKVPLTHFTFPIKSLGIIVIGS